MGKKIRQSETWIFLARDLANSTCADKRFTIRAQNTGPEGEIARRANHFCLTLEPIPNPAGRNVVKRKIDRRQEGLNISLNDNSNRDL